MQKLLPTRVNSRLRCDARKRLADAQVAAYMLSMKLAKTVPLNAKDETALLAQCDEIRRAQQSLFTTLEKANKVTP